MVVQAPLRSELVQGAAGWLRGKLWPRLWSPSWLTVEESNRPALLNRVQLTRAVSGMLITVLIAPTLFLDWSSKEASGVLAQEAANGLRVVAFMHPVLVVVISVLVAIGVGFRYSAMRHRSAEVWRDMRPMLWSILVTVLAYILAILGPWAIFLLGWVPALFLSSAGGPADVIEWFLYLLAWIAFALVGLIGTFGAVIAGTAGIILFWRWSFLVNRYAYRGAHIDSAVAPVSSVITAWAIVAADILLGAEVLVVPGWAQVGMGVFGAIAVTAMAVWELRLSRRPSDSLP